MPWTMPLLAAALWFAGCSDVTTPSDRMLGPDVAAFSKSKGGKPTQANEPKAYGRTRNGTEGAWEIGVGRRPSRYNSKHEAVVDGSQDVFLSAGGHILYIPKGAVSEPTDFKIQVEQRRLADGRDIVAVSLRASRLDPATGEEIDVGAQGFGGKVVYLALTPEWADNKPGSITNSNTTIVWLKSVSTDTGSTDLEDIVYVGDEVGQVNPYGKYIVATLEHFSDYALAFP